MKLKYNLDKKRVAKGFSMIELMVSMVITLVIVGVLLGMTKVAIGAWQNTNEKSKSSRLAQEVFDIVGRDFEGIVIGTGNNNEWVNISGSNLSSGELGPNGTTSIVNTLDLNFFTATPDRYDGQINTNADNGGDVSFVRYRIVYQDVIEGSSGSRPVYSLYRERIEPDVTFNNLLAQADLQGAIDSIPNSASSLVDPENLLAENIYDFTLSLNFEYDIDGGAKGYSRVVMQSDSVEGNQHLSINGNEILIGSSSTNLNELAIPANASSPRLFSADVSVYVISDGGMNAIRINPSSDDAKFSAFLREFGDHYAKSIILPQS